MALTDKLFAIGEAIREMTGGTELLTLDAMPDEIRGITTGGGSSADVRYVTFMSHDGAVELGRKAVAVGDDCADPIARGVFGTPTRESDVQYHYTFSGGWATVPNGGKDSNALKAVTEDRVVYANYAAVLRKYTVTFYDEDGSTLYSNQYNYGTIPSYTPTKEELEFVAWVPSLTAVTGDASYTATWKEKARFSTAPWSEIIAVAQSGNASTSFSVGDERTETITYADGTSEEITWVVVSLNRTCYTPDGTGDNMTIAAKHALSQKQKMATTVLGGSYNGGIVDTYLNDTFFHALPVDLQNGIKDIYIGAKVASCIRKIWIPSLRSFGLTRDNYGTGLYVGGPFEYYNSASRRTMTLGANGAAVEYWTTDVRNSGNYVYYATILATGEASTNNSVMANTSNAVVPMFCI